MPDDKLISFSDLPCCPEITKDPCCDRLKFTYRLEYNLSDLPVEIVITAELERCPGPLALGDVVYSTTLLPGERVRLFTSSRNSRFSYDSESEVTYRHEQASEETYYMTSVDRFMSDLTVNESGGGSAESSSEFETEGSVSNWTDAIFGRPDAKVEGNFSAESSFDFMRELSRHAEASHERSVQGTRAANSVAVGEVQSRSHAEGESESTYEASTRTIQNKNQCHAVTYIAYQLVKKQTVRYRVRSVLRRVKDPAADTAVATKPLRPNSRVGVIPNGVLATDTRRLDVETTARTAAASQKANLVGNIGGSGGLIGLSNSTLSATPLRFSERTIRVKPATSEARAAALAAVDKDLVKAGVIEKIGGEISPKLAAELGFEITTCLPTQAIVVKGCIDECNVCEESKQESIRLDLERKALENKLLGRQIELLEKSQDYRCCPVGEAEPTDTE
jgi:hypothetical protein